MREILTKVTCGGLTAIYRRETNTDAVELLLLPSEKNSRDLREPLTTQQKQIAGIILSSRDLKSGMKTEKGCCSAAGELLEAALRTDCAPEPLIQVKWQDEDSPAFFSGGRTMRNGKTVRSLRYVGQQVTETATGFSVTIT